MTNLITGIAIVTNILATNRVEFRTNVWEHTHPTNKLYIFNADDKSKDLIPFFKFRETNIVRIETLEYTWKGQRVALDRAETTLLKTQAVFQLNLCNWTWERVP